MALSFLQGAISYDETAGAIVVKQRDGSETMVLLQGAFPVDPTTGALLVKPLSGTGAALVAAHPGYIAGRFYATYNGPYNVATAIAAVDIIYFYPFLCPANITFTGGKARTQTAGAASSMKLGIWANSSVSMRPLGAPLYKDDTGVTTQASTTDVVPAIGAGSLTGGVLYWIGAKFTGTLPVMWGPSAAASAEPYLVGLPTTMNSCSISFADAYANAMPTIAEGATFVYPANGTPQAHLWLAT